MDCARLTHLGLFQSRKDQRMAYRKNKDGSFSYYTKKYTRTQHIIQKDWFKVNQYPKEFYEYVERKLSPGFRAYWALAIDGDGNVHERKKNKNNHEVSFSLADREPVQYLADLYKSSISLITFPSEAWRDVYRVSLQGQRCFHFLKLICPYMIEKKQAVINMINRKEPNYHPPKISMNFKKHPELLTLHMGMVAGFFDTEGSVGLQLYIQKRKTKTKGIRRHSIYNQWLHFTNTDLRPLRKIKKILETLPFTFKPTITVDKTKLLKKNGKPQKLRYKLSIPNNQHILFLALFEPIIMIQRKSAVLERLKLKKRIYEMIK